MIENYGRKTAMAAGAAKGLSAETARIFATHSDLVPVGRFEEVCRLRKGLNGKTGVPAILGDLTQESDVRRAVNKTAEACGKIDVLVCATGTLIPGSVTETSLDDRHYC